MFQIIVKEKGVFTNVTSPSTKAKLRILFEVAPLALLVRCPFRLTLRCICNLASKESDLCFVLQGCAAGPGVHHCSSHEILLLL